MPEAEIPVSLMCGCHCGCDAGIEIETREQADQEGWLSLERLIASRRQKLPGLFVGPLSPSAYALYVRHD